VGHDEKCGSCSWSVHTVYFAAEDHEEANKIYAETDRGLCAECLVRWADAEGVSLIWPESVDESRDPAKITDDLSLENILKLFQ
jgi:hypothetical protein